MTKWSRSGVSLRTKNSNRVSLKSTSNFPIFESFTSRHVDDSDQKIKVSYLIWHTVSVAIAHRVCQDMTVTVLQQTHVSIQLNLFQTRCNCGHTSMARHRSCRCNRTWSNTSIHLMSQYVFVYTYKLYLCSACECACLAVCDEISSQLQELKAKGELVANWHQYSGPCE